MTELVVGECGVCGARRFPVALWCHVCGSDAIRGVAASRGTVAETTVLLHAPGRRLEPVRLGTVMLAGGGAVIARLDLAVDEGADVEVVVEDGAPVARVARSS